MNPRRPLASIDELAAYLQVPVQTIYRWNSRRTGPKFTKLGRHVRYLWEDIDRWVKNSPTFG